MFQFTSDCIIGIDELDEEEYLEQLQYEGLEIQHRAHQAFIAKIEQIKTYDFTQHTQEEFEEVIEFLLNWLVQHILNLDKKIPVQS